MTTPFIEKIKLELDEIRELQFDGSPYQLERKCSQILEFITELMNACDDENARRDYLDAKLALAHTMDKEVQYVFSFYKDRNKKNSPVKRKRDYENELSKTMSLFKIDK